MILLTELVTSRHAVSLLLHFLPISNLSLKTQTIMPPSTIKPPLAPDDGSSKRDSFYEDSPGSGKSKPRLSLYETPTSTNKKTVGKDAVPASPFESPFSARGSIISLASPVADLKSPVLKGKGRTRCSKRAHHLENLKAKSLLFEKIDQFTAPLVTKTQEETDLIRESLKDSFVFQKVSPEEMEELIGAFQPVEFEENDRIIKQGDVYDHFYVIAKGEVKYVVDKAKVGTGGPGDYFGELALLYDCKRAASVIATTATKLFRVDQLTMRQLLQKQTKKEEKMKMKLIDGVDILQKLPKSAKKKLAAVMRPRLFKRGDVIAKPKSKDSQAFFIVREGELKVVDHDTEEKSRLKKGDYLGTNAICDLPMKNVTVKGLNNGTILYIKSSTFTKVVGKYSDLVSKDKRVEWLVSIQTICCCGNRWW